MAASCRAGRLRLRRERKEAGTLAEGSRRLRMLLGQASRTCCQNGACASASARRASRRRGTLAPAGDSGQGLCSSRPRVHGRLLGRWRRSRTAGVVCSRSPPRSPSSWRMVRSSREAKAASRCSSTVALLLHSSMPWSKSSCPGRARPSRVRRGSRAARERSGPWHRAAQRPSTRPERVRKRAQDTLRAG